jgi:hypothetical protein
MERVHGSYQVALEEQRSASLVGPDPVPGAAAWLGIAIVVAGVANDTLARRDRDVILGRRPVEIARAARSEAPDVRGGS